MAPGIPSLPLTPSWQKERLSLVRITDAIRLCCEGSHEELPPQQSLPYLLEAGRERLAEARDFVAKAQLFSRSLTDCSDALLFDQLRKLVKLGMLVVVRESEKSATKETSSLVRQRRVIRALDQTKRYALRFEGRTYRLVADADLSKMSGRENYTVVSHAEAIRVLDELAKLGPSGQADQLLEARKQLSQDWHPPMPPDGFVLLKQIVVPQSVPKSEAPLGKPERTSAAEAPSEVPPEEEEGEECRPCAVALAQASQQGTPFCNECNHPSTAAG